MGIERNEMTDAIVLGNGIVGQATAKALDIPFYYDLKGSNITLQEASRKLFCFICLPTDTDEQGQQTASRKVIHDYIAQMKGYGGRNIFVIRSTVLPGTARALAEEFNVMVASNPEFLTENYWELDAVKPRLLVIGADVMAAQTALKNAWKDVKCKIRITTDTVTAETIKYAFNTFMATKVVFANQMYDICETNGADYETIREVLHQHPWGSKHHLMPIHKGGRGAGGKCLPKDLKAFTKYSNSKLLQAVMDINNEYLSKSGKQ
jgi:nucleotide sugar dehydrogenase